MLCSGSNASSILTSFGPKKMNKRKQKEIQKSCSSVDGFPSCCIRMWTCQLCSHWSKWTVMNFGQRYSHEYIHLLINYWTEIMHTLLAILPGLLLHFVLVSISAVRHNKFHRKFSTLIEKTVILDISVSILAYSSFLWTFVPSIFP